MTRIICLCYKKYCTVLLDGGKDVHNSSPKASVTFTFYEHPQTLLFWSVHFEKKGNLLLPNQVVIKGKDFVVVFV